MLPSPSLACFVSDVLLDLGRESATEHSRSLINVCWVNLSQACSLRFKLLLIHVHSLSVLGICLAILGSYTISLAPPESLVVWCDDVVGIFRKIFLKHLCVWVFCLNVYLHTPHVFLVL